MDFLTLKKHLYAKVLFCLPGILYIGQNNFKFRILLNDFLYAAEFITN